MSLEHSFVTSFFDFLNEEIPEKIKKSQKLYTNDSKWRESRVQISISHKFSKRVNDIYHVVVLFRFMIHGGGFHDVKDFEGVRVTSVIKAI